MVPAPPHHPKADYPSNTYGEKSMKHKTIRIISFIAIPLLAAVSVLHAQTRDEEKEALWASFINEIQSLIDASEFDLQFTITDTDGKPLDGVKVEMRLERQVPGLILSGGSESKKLEEKTVDSKFRFQEKGWTKLELMFKKSGYHIEDRRYTINIMPNNPDELGPDGKPKTVMREDIQIQMYKGIPAADLTGTSGVLQYDFEKGQKTVCDLSMFDKKPDKPKKTAVSENGEEKGRKIGMKQIDLKTKPEATKYIEVDFRRDENGEVLFDGMLRDTPCPASFIIRLHSDDPEDGFIVVDKFGPGYVRPEEYEKNCPTAPETGYKKELVFDLGKKSADGKYTYEDIHTFAFVKCGQHYGKVFFNPIYVDIGRNRPLRLFRRKIELMINRTEGDRNVSDGVFYIERKQPDQNRIVPDKAEAKNEVKTAPEDKAETAKKMITLLGDALQQYKLDVGTYPSDLQGLMKNVDKSERWDGPYIRPNVPPDPWGNAYQYSFDAEKGTYRLTSSGLPETKPGTHTNHAEPTVKELQQQLAQGEKAHKELYSKLQTLQQTPGATKEQIDLVVQSLELSQEKLERLNKQLIERIREQQNKLRP